MSVSAEDTISNVSELPNENVIKTFLSPIVTTYIMRKRLKIAFSDRSFLVSDLMTEVKKHLTFVGTYDVCLKGKSEIYHMKQVIIAIAEIFEMFFFGDAGIKTILDHELSMLHVEDVNKMELHEDNFESLGNWLMRFKYYLIRFS
jgi:hypothetical protein